MRLKIEDPSPDSNPPKEQIAGARRRFRVRCFKYADRWFARIGKLLSAVHEGFWLGYLSADDLNAITADHFSASQLYKSREHNLSGFLPWEAPLIERYFQRGCKILIAGAGAGREVLALRKAGYEAEGFECSLPLIRAGQEIFDHLGERYDIITCAPDAVPSGTPDYDGLIVGWVHIRTFRLKSAGSLSCKL